MASRADRRVDLIAARPVAERIGSRPKSPKAMAQSASLDASRTATDDNHAKRRLNSKTVAGPR